MEMIVANLINVFFLFLVTTVVVLCWALFKNAITGVIEQSNILHRFFIASFSAVALSLFAGMLLPALLSVFFPPWPALPQSIVQLSTHVSALILLISMGTFLLSGALLIVVPNMQED